MPGAPAMDSRLHIALHVKDLTKSEAFYRALFDQEPDKVKDGYIRFNLDSPPVVLTLNSKDKVRKGNRLDHMGIRVEHSSQLDSALARMRELGCWVKEQPDVICCHSRQSKFWVQDPDGTHWEIYVLVDDMKELAETESAQSTCGE